MFIWKIQDMADEAGIENFSQEEIIESMLVSARSIIRTCMEIRNHEDVVIITDTHTSEIAVSYTHLTLPTILLV